MPPSSQPHGPQQRPASGGVSSSSAVDLVVDGEAVSVPDDGASLLEVLRERLGHRSVKDGCSPQGQCGCCTVLVDGAPRVACVTPVRRVAGREVVTPEGLEDADAQRWAAALCATGGSQCGFCTPGIVVRLEGLRRRGRADAGDHAAVERALAAHLCRCTGWATILEAWDRVLRDDVPSQGGMAGRDAGAAGRRAELEGGVAQVVGPDVALGAGGFADDTAPLDALVAVPDGSGGWALGETVAEARAAAGKVQGRRTTVPAEAPLEVPPGDWQVSLATSWVEPAYLETDASWCEPGGEPASPLGNGGAFGGKASSPLPAVARRLADEHGRAVRVLWAREDVVRHGPKRPPVALGVRADGTGLMRVARPSDAGVDEVADRVAAVAPGLEVELVDLAGPPVSLALRGAVWLEAVVALGAASGAEGLSAPGGGWASAAVADDGGLDVRVRCGPVLDEVVLRSYCMGAVHQALGLVTSESLAVDADGEPLDLTIRSFGVLRAADVPVVRIAVDDADEDAGPAVNGSDAVLAAVALAAWRHQGLAPTWPTGAPLGSAP